MIQVHEGIIGKVGCVLGLNYLSDKVDCKKAFITAYMVERFGTGIKAKVRFHDGRWEYVENVFFPEEEAAERKRFEEKYGKK